MLADLSGRSANLLLIQPGFRSGSGKSRSTCAMLSVSGALSEQQHHSGLIYWPDQPIQVEGPNALVRQESCSDPDTVFVERR